MLCLNRRQIAVRPARPRSLDREVLEATYGGAIVELPAAAAAAILPTTTITTTDVLEPLPGSVHAAGASLEMPCSALAGGALGCWVVLYELSYAAESLAHSIFPGLVLAALAGVPLLLGAAPAIVARGAGDRARRAVAGRRAATRRSRSS